MVVSIFTILKVILLITSILLIYFIGNMHGLITGISFAEHLNNRSLCAFINKNANTSYKEENGYCILRENYTLNIKVDCVYGGFMFKGERDMNTFEKIIYFPQRLIYYPLLGCW